MEWNPVGGPPWEVLAGKPALLPSSHFVQFDDQLALLLKIAASTQSNLDDARGSQVREAAFKAAQLLTEPWTTETINLARLKTSLNDPSLKDAFDDAEDYRRVPISFQGAGRREKQSLTQQNDALWIEIREGNFGGLIACDPAAGVAVHILQDPLSRLERIRHIATLSNGDWRKGTDLPTQSLARIEDAADAKGLDDSATSSAGEVLTYEEVAKHLRPSEAAALIVPTSIGTFVSIVDSSGRVNSKMSDTANVELYKQIEQLRQGLIPPSQHVPGSQFPYGLAHAIYDEIFQGLLEDKHDVDHLYIVAASRSSTIPFNSLVTSQVEPNFEYRGLRFIGDKFKIIVVPSVSLFKWRNLTTDPGVKGTQARALSFFGIGAPKLSGEPGCGSKVETTSDRGLADASCCPVATLCPTAKR